MLIITKKIALGFVVVSLLASSCVSKKKFDELTKEKQDLSANLSKLQSDFNGYKEVQAKEIDMLKASNASLVTEKDNLGAKLNSVEGQLSSAKSSLEGQIGQSADELKNLKSELNAAFADVNAAVTSTNARVKDVEQFLYLDLDEEVNFKLGSASISPDDTKQLKKLADMLKANPKLALMIEGHTDSRKYAAGSSMDNWDLSVKRATNIVRKLIKLGVDPKQLIAAGSAENKIIDGKNGKDADNRRVEAILVPNVGKLFKVSKGMQP